jgi:hypothetical protein
MFYDAIAQKHLHLANQAQICPPYGANIVGYVRSTGALSATDAIGLIPNAFSSLATPTTPTYYATVAAAMAACVSGRQNYIYVLPGHSESVGTTLMTGAVADTTLVGVGDTTVDSGPTLLWSGATSNMAVAIKNFRMINLRLRADADNVTEAITITAAGFRMIGCQVDAGIGSSTDILIMCNVSTNANDAAFVGNQMRCTAGGNTTLIKMAAVVDNLQIINNHIFGTSQSTTLGNLSMTAALTNVLIAGNWVDQQKASGTAALNISDVAATGFVCDNILGTLSAGGQGGAEGILLAGTTNILIHFANNLNADGLKGTSGILCPVVTS